MVFDNLQDALDIYNELVEANGFFYKDMYHELYKDEEVLLSFTIINDNDAAVLFVANRPTGGYVLEVYIIPNNKRIMVRDSKKTNGEVFTYYFDPEKEEEKEEWYLSYEWDLFSYLNSSPIFLHDFIVKLAARHKIKSMKRFELIVRYRKFLTQMHNEKMVGIILIGFILLLSMECKSQENPL